MASVTTPSTSTGEGLDWMQGLRTGNLVELLVYGQRMTGRVLRINPDNFTMKIPVEQQSGDVRRFSVTGTAVVSLEGAAANVPVSVQSTGEFVRMQVIGPAEIIQRRRFVRVRVALPIKLAWKSDGTWCYAESRTQDISTGGIRVAPARAVWPSAGEEVAASLEFPDGTVAQERAKVIGKTPEYGLRVEFTQLSAPTRQWITNLIGQDGSPG
jgi:c-di-GMP-binding flagellar brake protein YcgR